MKEKKILTRIRILLIIVVIVLVFLLVGIRLFNIQIYTVLSGSMEPTYKTGSLLYVKETDSSKLEVGDTITYKTVSGTIVTHRIVDVIDAADDGEVYFQTKGDANELVDGSLVSSSSVMGKALFSIPYLGYLLAFIQHPPGLYIAIGVCAVVVWMSFVSDINTGKKQEDDKKK